MRHYEMTSERFGTHKGYEFYGGLNKYIAKRGAEGAALDFANLMPWGTPDEVLEKMAFIRETIGANGFMVGTSYAGMPYPEAERNLRCFTENVLPELRKWDVEPLAEPAALEIAGEA
jgi:hypothetical protein